MPTPYAFGGTTLPTGLTTFASGSGLTPVVVDGRLEFRFDVSSVFAGWSKLRTLTEDYTDGRFFGRVTANPGYETLVVLQNPATGDGLAFSHYNDGVSESLNYGVVSGGDIGSTSVSGGVSESSAYLGLLHVSVQSLWQWQRTSVVGDGPGTWADHPVQLYVAAGHNPAAMRGEVWCRPVSGFAVSGVGGTVDGINGPLVASVPSLSPLYRALLAAGEL